MCFTAVSMDAFSCSIGWLWPSLFLLHVGMFRAFFPEHLSFFNPVMVWPCQVEKRLPGSRAREDAFFFLPEDSNHMLKIICLSMGAFKSVFESWPRPFSFLGKICEKWFDTVSFLGLRASDWSKITYLALCLRQE